MSIFAVVAVWKDFLWPVIVNLSAGPVPLPSRDEILLSSAPVTGGMLPPDTAVWLRAR